MQRYEEQQIENRKEELKKMRIQKKNARIAKKQQEIKPRVHKPNFV